ncbi:MAG: glutaminyl-peptide cyclotransferase, partial [Acidimicrobiales bacterium]
ATLTFRDPNSFAILGSVEVTRDGDLVTQINELECVNGQVVANVWKSSTLIVIEPSTGEVVGTVDASALVRAADRDDANAVLNGIAFDPVTETFWLTGKLWPTMYNVRIVSR